jgi:hypothetical protein
VYRFRTVCKRSLAATLIAVAALGGVGLVHSGMMPAKHAVVVADGTWCC